MTMHTVWPHDKRSHWLLLETGLFVAHKSFAFAFIVCALRTTYYSCCVPMIEHGRASAVRAN
jgi:hypothetical protein